MKNTILLFSFLFSSLLHAQEIKEGTLTNRDIMDTLDMKAWVWDVEDSEGFKTIKVDIEAHQRDREERWKEPNVAGHTMVYSKARTDDRVVVVIQGNRVFLKVGNIYGDLSIDLGDYKLEQPTYTNVGSIGQRVDDGFIIMSQSIERNISREAIDTKDFYLLVKITTE